jgi:methionyl-tRNA formyltransferase
MTPARQAADEYGITISDKEDVNSAEFFEFLYLVRPDLIFVCDFGQILSKRTLSGSLLGGINLHGSLLPKFRGAAPVHWAILTGEHYTGVSIIHMTPQIDAGPVIAQSPPIPIGSSETVVELEARLAEYGAGLVFGTVSKMAHNETIRIIEQLRDKVSKAPRLTKESGFISWDRPSQEIFNHYRATILWPRAFTDWHRENGSILRLILGKITPLNNSLTELTNNDLNQVPLIVPVLTDAKMDNLADLKAASKKPKSLSVKRPSSHSRPSWWKPGIVIRAEGNDFIIAAKEGAVRIELIQPAGKKMMQVADFLRGYPIKQGDKLG